jgi:hypothetical protein
LVTFWGQKIKKNIFCRKKKLKNWQKSFLEKKIRKYFFRKQFRISPIQDFMKTMSFFVIRGACIGEIRVSFAYKHSSFLLKKLFFVPQKLKKSYSKAL